MDRCERTNENGESAFWEGHWLERTIKNFLIPQKAMQERYKRYGKKWDFF